MDGCAWRPLQVQLEKHYCWGYCFIPVLCKCQWQYGILPRRVATLEGEREREGGGEGRAREGEEEGIGRGRRGRAREGRRED